MDKETVQELLKKANELASTEQLKTLVGSLETFLSLQEESNTLPDNQELQDKWLAARDSLWANFDKVIEAEGISPELIRQQLKSSDLFSGEHRNVYEKLKELNNGKA